MMPSVSFIVDGVTKKMPATTQAMIVMQQPTSDYILELIGRNAT
jgi:hypothetical protein